MQLRVCGDHQFIADRNIAPELGIVNVPDANVIAALLNGGIALQPLNALFGVSSEPFAGIDSADYLYFIGIAGGHVDGAGAGFHLQVHGSADVESATEFAPG